MRNMSTTTRTTCQFSGDNAQYIVTHEPRSFSAKVPRWIFSAKVPTPVVMNLLIQ